MKITNVKSNLKRGVNVVLGEKVTLIVAPNFGGKTSLVTALKLGLTGKCDEIGTATGADLMLLAPEDHRDLKVSIDFDDGTSAIFGTEGTTAKASRPKFYAGEAKGAILSDQVHTLLTGSANSLRAALLQACSPSDALAVAAKSIPEEFRPRWDEAVASARTLIVEEDGEKNPVDADVLAKAVFVLGKQLRAARAIVRAGADNQPPPTVSEEDLAEARLEVAGLEKVETACKRLEAAASRQAALIPELDAARAAAVANGALLSAPEIKAARLRLDGAKALRLKLSLTDGGACLACGCESTPETLAAAAARQEQAESVLKQHESKKPTSGRSVSELEGELSEIDAMTQQDVQVLVVAKLDSPVRITTPAAVELLSRARLNLGRLNDLASTRLAWEEARTESVKAKARVDALDGLTKTMKRVVKELLFDSIDLFAKRASEALPTGYEITIQLYDGDRSIAPRLKMLTPRTKTHVPWQGLSGAERAIAFAAFASAWAQEEKAPVKLVVVDETWLGEQAIVDLCSALNRAKGLTQAVVCAVSYDGPEILGTKIVRVAL